MERVREFLSSAPLVRIEWGDVSLAFEISSRLGVPPLLSLEAPNDVKKIEINGKVLERSQEYFCLTPKEVFANGIPDTILVDGRKISVTKASCGDHSNLEKINSLLMVALYHAYVAC